MKFLHEPLRSSVSASHSIMASHKQPVWPLKPDVLQAHLLHTGPYGWRAHCGGRSTLCRAPCGPHGLHLPEASSTRCPTECNNRNVSGQCHRAQRAKVVQAEDPCRGVPPHWTSGEERDQRKAASEEREASQFPELIRYVTYSDPYQAR